MRDQRGFTLVEVLVVMTGLLTVMGAALTMLQGFDVTTREAAARADDQQAVRATLDGLTRELRNLASPTQGQPDAVDKADPFDLVFQTVDPAWEAGTSNVANVQRVRYCLSASTGRVHKQTQRWRSLETPAVPGTGSCPEPQSAGGWTRTQVLAQHVRNRHDGKETPVFLYDSAVAADITRVRAILHVDTDASRGPATTRLSSGVFLRNQNRRPVAAFTAVTQSGHILLNGSPSVDPEGGGLRYVWWDGTEKVGEGVTFDYVPPAGGSTTRSIVLKVYDPSDLEGVSAPQAVTVG